MSVYEKSYMRCRRCQPSLIPGSPQLEIDQERACRVAHAVPAADLPSCGADGARTVFPVNDRSLTKTSRGTLRLTCIDRVYI